MMAVSLSLLPRPAWTVAAGLGAIALVVGAQIALDNLQTVRAERAELERIVAAPRPSASTSAPDSAHRSRVLAESLRQAAARTGVLVERVVPATRKNSVLAEVTLVASGPEHGLMTFAAEIEHRQPAIRFTTWRIAPIADGNAVRLEASAVSIAGAGQ